MNTSKNKKGNHYPLDNMTYNLITIIQEKSQGLEAFDQFIKDAEGNDELRQMLEQIRQQDEECIMALQPHLSRLLSEQNAEGRTPAATGKANAAGAGRGTGMNKNTSSRAR